MSILDFSSATPDDMRKASILMSAESFLKACGRVRLSLQGAEFTVVEGTVQSAGLDGTVTFLTDAGDIMQFATNQVVHVLVLEVLP